MMRSFSTFAFIAMIFIMLRTPIALTIAAMMYGGVPLQFLISDIISIMSRCSHCDCSDFSLNPFKKDVCNNCFHKHVVSGHASPAVEEKTTLKSGSAALKSGLCDVRQLV